VVHTDVSLLLSLPGYRCISQGTCLALLCALLCAPRLTFAVTGAEDLLRRQQDADAARRDRRVEEIYRPGEAPAPTEPPSRIDEKPCFLIDQLQLEGADAVLSSPLQQDVRAAWQGHCLGASAIRELQVRLTDWLVQRGYVTSRVLLPEQELSTGTLRLVVVPGRIEGYAGELPARTFIAAFPDAEGDVLRLPALEQGIENLGRIPGMRPTLDIEPGAQNGGSRVRVQGTAGRHWQAQASLDAHTLEDEADLMGRGALVLGNLLGVADRFRIASGRQLDDHRVDLSEDGSVELDLPYGFWHFSMSHDQQRYRNDLAGVLTTFTSRGDNANTRLELNRVLRRHGNSRLAMALLAGEGRSENRIDDTVIQVSSYRLRTLGVRVEHSMQARGTAWTQWLTLDTGDASGPATHPFGGSPIADTQAERAQYYVHAAHPLNSGRSALTATLNAQYSDDALYPLQQFSLTADSAVRGFFDTSVTTSNALVLRAELTHGWQPGNLRLPGALQPSLGVDLGWTGNGRQETAAARAMSMTLGLLWHGANWQCLFSASDPFGGASSIGPTAPSLAATMIWSY
jgi:hemolysin activation/secretion protein